MKEVKELLKDHPYFVENYKDDGKEMFVFSNNENYGIRIPHTLNLSEDFEGQFDYISSGKEVYIQEYPIWFKKLYAKIYNLYYEKNKIRYLVNFGRKPYDDIVWLHSFFVEDGFDFFFVTDVKEDGTVILEKKWKEEMEKVRTQLEKEKYELIFLKETNEKVIYKLK